jgi:hypothetical protein
MRPIQHRAATAANGDEAMDDQVPSTPDEDGPHDVPDEQVIEKTLPTAPVHHDGGNGRP